MVGFERIYIVFEVWLISNFSLFYRDRKLSGWWKIFDDPESTADVFGANLCKSCTSLLECSDQLAIKCIFIRQGLNLQSQWQWFLHSSI